MGWTYSIEREDSPTPPNVDVDALISELYDVDSRVDVAYQGLAQKTVLRDCATRKAAQYGCVLKPSLKKDQKALKQAKKEKFEAKKAGLTVAKKVNDAFDMNEECFEICAKGVPNGLLHLLTLRFRFQLYPDLPQGPTTCPACRRTFIPQSGDTSSKWTEAHNVIPASLWFKIVPEALLEFVGNLTVTGNDVQPRANAIVYLKDLIGKYKRTGFADSGERSGATIDLMIANMCRAGAECGGPGTSGNHPYTGAQCPACEKLHGPYSLICRLKTVGERSDLNSQAKEFVGWQFLDYLQRTKTALGKDNTAEILTVKVADMVLDEMQVRMMARGVTDELGTWLKDKLDRGWSDFANYVRVWAVRACADQIYV
ncbi:hypothetical protein G3N95_02770 [Paraburkholderia sp. Tr-20389]|uniref:hypothetical protein n=1 Tax=Paraburkholderia sp. Tr-20389 TaxID=2703903 RepID=UPI00197DD636|nr:hypothetical protein [Paraburkholderia sp. Tr-20389]MBN3751848.1 hypothetical protein [Paraburkholderia sp. Tr-20389]